MQSATCRNLVPLLVLPVLLCGGTAQAEQPHAVLGSFAIGQTVDFVVDGTGGVFELPVHPQVITALHFTSPVRKGVSERKGFDIQLKDERVYLKPQPGVDREVLGNAHLLADGYEVSMLLRVVERPEDAVALGVVRQRTETERQMDRAAEIQSAVHRRETELRTALEATYQQRMRDERLFLAMERLLVDRALIPIIDEVAGDSGPVRAQMGPGAWVGEALWTSFELHNGNDEPLVVEEVYVAGHDGELARVEDMAIGAPGAPDRTPVTRLLPGQRARGVLRVPDALRGMTPRAVMFHVAGMPRPIVAATEDWVLVPRRRSEIDADKAARGRIALRLQALGGAIWLANPLATERMDPTALRGLGVRATVGINRMLAFEAEAAGARSGESRFADVTWNDTQGDLLRRATLGRVHFGLVLHTGKRYVSFVRLGQGLQGTSSDTQLVTAAGERMSGPEVDFEFKGFQVFGTGLDIRLGEHFLAGVAVTAHLLSFGTLQSLEAGVHLGYTWKP